MHFASVVHLRFVCKLSNFADTDARSALGNSYVAGSGEGEPRLGARSSPLENRRLNDDRGEAIEVSRSAVVGPRKLPKPVALRKVSAPRLADRDARADSQNDQITN